jgi:hypothetical protein
MVGHATGIGGVPGKRSSGDAADRYSNPPVSAVVCADDFVTVPNRAAMPDTAGSADVV